MTHHQEEAVDGKSALAASCLSWSMATDDVGRVYMQARRILSLRDKDLLWKADMWSLLLNVLTTQARDNAPSEDKT